MKTNLVRDLVTLATVFAITAGSAQAQITISSQAEGFLGSTKTQVTTAHNGSTQLSFDATGVDKLVVVFATESGFNNRTTTAMTMSFNGVAMTQAIFQNSPLTDPTSPVNDNGAISIFYLDDPFQGAANFSTTQTHTGGGSNGGWVSVFGLTGTLDGLGAVNGTSYNGAGTYSTSITTTGNDSLVIAGIQNSGANNSSGSANVVGPLTLGNEGIWGSNWGQGASGYQFVTTSGTNITPTFTTGNGAYRDVAAVEFLAIPEPSSFALMGLGLGALYVLRRRH
jgi:hypothetical protein